MFDSEVLKKLFLSAIFYQQFQFAAGVLDRNQSTMSESAKILDEMINNITRESDGKACGKLLS